jgi:hypothetical protein
VVTEGSIILCDACANYTCLMLSLPSRPLTVATSLRVERDILASPLVEPTLEAFVLILPTNLSDQTADDVSYGLRGCHWTARGGRSGERSRPRETLLLRVGDIGSHRWGTVASLLLSSAPSAAYGHSSTGRLSPIITPTGTIWPSSACSRTSTTMWKALSGAAS